MVNWTYPRVGRNKWFDGHDYTLYLSGGVTATLTPAQYENLKQSMKLIAQIETPLTDEQIDEIFGRAATPRRTRRKMTPDFLRQVSEIYQSVPKGGRVAALQEAFNVCERTALRYMRMVREKGLVDETPP